MLGTVDAILVLGGGLDADHELDDCARQKLDYAASLLERRGPAAVIVSGGYSYKLPTPPPITEARIMRDYLVSIGVVRSNIFCEEESKDTFGNIYFSKVTFLKPNNWQNVLVVASINHSLNRVNYLLTKILGDTYTYELTAEKTNDDNLNKIRESRSPALAKQLLDDVNDGDDATIFKIMQQKHVAYCDSPEMSIAEIEKYFSSE